MRIFSRNKNEGKLILVFDIGSSSVGGALFRTQKSGVPKIVLSLREPISLQKTLDIDKFLSLTVKSLEVVVGKIYKAALGRPEEIYCVLSSPWHISQTRVIKMEKNTPFVFSAKVAMELIQKEAALFEEECMAKYSDENRSLRSIEFKNIKTVLNGYESPSPLDQKARELEMTIFLSMSPEQVLHTIEETVRKCFHFKNIKFSSFKLASFAVMRDVYAHKENFLLIDVDGEVTEISMVKKNVLRESVSYPLGCNFIIRKVASSLHSPLREAKSLVSLLKDGHAGREIAEKLDLVVSKVKKDWLLQFQQSLANISNDISVPSTIYLTVDKEMADFFSEIIKNEQFNQYTLTESKFEIIFLGAEVFEGMAVFGEKVAREPGLIIDSIYVNRFLINSNEMSKI